MNKTENLLVSIHLIAHRKKTAISVEQLATVEQSRGTSRERDALN